MCVILSGDLLVESCRRDLCVCVIICLSSLVGGICVCVYVCVILSGDLLVESCKRDLCVCVILSGDLLCVCVSFLAICLLSLVRGICVCVCDLFWRFACRVGSVCVCVILSGNLLVESCKRDLCVCVILSGDLLFACRLVRGDLCVCDSFWRFACRVL